MKFLINITHAFPTLRELMVPNGSSKVLQGARTSWRTSLFTVQGSSPHLFSLHWHLNFLMIFKSSDENNCGFIFCPFSLGSLADWLTESFDLKEEQEPFTLNIYWRATSHKHVLINGSSILNLNLEQRAGCLYLWYFCPFLLWYSVSSTVHTAPFPPSTRTKHLCKLRLCRTAFW